MQILVTFPIKPKESKKIDSYKDQQNVGVKLSRTYWTDLNFKGLHDMHVYFLDCSMQID